MSLYFIVQSVETKLRIYILNIFVLYLFDHYSWKHVGFPE